MSDKKDLGGFSIEQLMGLEPVERTKREQRLLDGRRGVASTMLLAPFRLAGLIITGPFVIVHHLVKMLTKPFRKRTR